VGGGSYHGFKYLPVIGGLVVKLLRGELDEEHRTRWGWDHRRKENIYPDFLPKRDLAELWGCREAKKLGQNIAL